MKGRATSAILLKKQTCLAINLGNTECATKVWFFLIQIKY